MTLSERRGRFVSEHVLDWNTTQAPIRVGCSEKTAKQIGSRLFTFVDVQTEIASEPANTIVRRSLSFIPSCAGEKEAQ